MAANWRVVLFDLDGTLRLSEPSANQVFFDYAVSLGAPDSPALRRRIAQWAHYYWAQSDELLEDRHMLSNGQNEQFWIKYAERSLLAVDCTPEHARQLAPELQSYMDANYQPKDVVPDDALDTLLALKQAGYRLGMVSNRGGPYTEELEQLGLASFFEYTLAAGEIDLWKPNPAIFCHALQEMESRPEQAVYVGDNYYADIIGAQRAGLEPVLYDPENVFPDADCLVISQFSELLPSLSNSVES